MVQTNVNTLKIESKNLDILDKHLINSLILVSDVWRKFVSLEWENTCDTC